MILGRAPIPSLWSLGLGLSMASSLDGVTHITVIADLFACEWMGRGKLVPLLLPGLGALGPWMIRAAAKRVTAASSH